MAWLYFADKIDTAVKGQKKVKKAIVGVLAIILSLTFVLALAGCNNQRQAPSEDKDKLIYGSTHNPDASNSEHTVSGEGMPLDTTTLDTAVSYANYAEIVGGLNTDKMAISSAHHLPIWKFDTLKELERFKQLNGEFTFDSGYDEVSSFNDTVEKYGEGFYEENSLMLVYVPANSGSYRYGVSSVYCDGTTFCIHVEQINNPKEGTTDMAGWFITVAVPDNMVENCFEFDADLNNSEN